MDIVLIGGLWLPSSVWGDVVAPLADLGHRALPVQVPGADDRSTTATLDDQLAAVLAIVDAAERPVVVGHSAASTLAWMIADRRPTAIAATVTLGGFPSGDGAMYADYFEPVDGLVGFPGWAPFDGPDSDDLDQAARSRLESITVPVPATVTRARVTLSDERRYDVPITVICPEFSPDQARAWIDEGEVPELQRATRVSLIDIESGHWPMISRPVELARLLHEIARSVDGSGS